MKLEGLHHVTMITADAQRTVDFYADLLGLRLVKKTVNFDQPDAYHLYFGDEQGSPGSILTWFEFPGAAPGRAGAGMIHLLQLGVGSQAALDFWAQRLRDAGHDVQRGEALAALRRPRRPGLRAGRRRGRQPAAARAAPRHPGRARHHRRRGRAGLRPWRRRGGGRPAPHGRPGVRRPRRRRVPPRRRRAPRALGLRRAAGRPPAARRRDGAPHRVGVARRGPSRLAGARARRRPARHRGARPRLLPVDLLPRADRGPLRDRHALAGVRRRRGPRAPGRGAARPGDARASARPARARS